MRFVTVWLAQWSKKMQSNTKRRSPLRFLTATSRAERTQKYGLKKARKRLSSPNVNRWRRRIIDSQLVDPVSEKTCEYVYQRQLYVNAQSRSGTIMLHRLFSSDYFRTILKSYQGSENVAIGAEEMTC